MMNLPMRRKRIFLVWGPANAGKSTLVSSLMSPAKDGLRSWTPCDYYDYDESAPSITRHFGPASPNRLITVGPADWRGLQKAMAESLKRAESGEIRSLVWDGLSAYYTDDCGIEAFDHPDAITAGGNAALRTRISPANRLGAILAMLRKIKDRAKHDDFLVIVTAHAKRAGSMDDPVLAPDMAGNAWLRLFRLCECVFQLERKGSNAPSLLYKDPAHETRRIKNPGALAYFDLLHSDARKHADKIAQMRTIPGLVALLEHCEGKAADDGDERRAQVIDDKHDAQIAAATPKT